MDTQLFTQPDYAPGLHNASADELLRMADAEPAPSPLLRALVEALADLVGIEDQLEALQEEVQRERDQWEADEKALEDRLEDADEANDALWDSLKSVMDYAERTVSDLEASSEDGEADSEEAATARAALDDAYVTLNDHPGPTERARREAEQERKRAAQWKPGTYGAGPRRWHVYRVTANGQEQLCDARGAYRRFGSHATAQRAADEANRAP